VTVSDPFISNLTRIADTTGDNDNLLEVGETWAYTASHTVTQAEIDSGNNIVNVATADSNETGPDTDDASIPVVQNPSLNITKDASVPGNTADVAGEVISYTIGVQNTGNQTLTGVTVSDPFISNLTRIADTTGDNDNLLEVGETWAYTASHTVTQAEIDAGVPIVNTATADSNETGPDTDDASIPVVQKGSIGDFVWEDLNYNGKQDANEPGIAGVTVNLLDTNGNVVKTTQTGSGNDLGKYLFGNVAPGDYSIQVVKPSNGYFFTKPNVPGDDAVDSDVGNTGLTAIFNLSAGENDLTVDAGLYRKANLGDLVWLDRDNDGIQDGNEKGVDKVIVKLLDASGAQVAMTTTDASGKYLFSNLDPGSYTIEFDKSLAQTGAISVAKYPWSSKQNQGGDDGLDSDVSGSGFKATVSVTLESNENDLTQDAAITPIVIDLNGDGIKTIARADSQGTFDLLGTGSGINSGWLSGDDGFLVIDRNGNGSIDDISEMFGGSSKGDGFAKLASFDSNGDGVVDAKDADFAGLKIWRDVNGNHQTDDGELMSLADAGLVGLSISYSELPFLDAKGNLHLERGSATRADGSVVDMTDVYFNISASDAAAAGVQAPTLAELMGSDNSFDSLMTDVAAVAGQEPFDTAMGEAADSTNGGYAADWSGMNSMEVQLIGQAEASFSGVF
jgi:serine-aspartate repeat-containing protein C/D/E